MKHEEQIGGFAFAIQRSPRETKMTPTPAISDRRRYARIPFDSPVRIEKVPKRSPTDVEHLLSEDLSEGGIRLSSPRFYSVQDRMLLELEMPEEPGSIRAIGTVVWVEQSSYQYQFRVGVRFSDVSETDRSRLRNIVHHRHSAQ
jgi:c-di-GMP-binding flagellar brake protein YcgR